MIINFKFHSFKLEEIKKKVEKYEKKLGSSINFSFSDPYFGYDYSDIFGCIQKGTIEIPDVECIDQTHRIVAIIDARSNNDDTKLLHLFDENFFEVAESYRSQEKFHCNHCNTNRKHSVTYTILNEKTGEVLQVGRSCFKDYFKIEDPYHFFLTLFPEVKEFSEFDEGSWLFKDYQNKARFSVHDILAIGCHLIDKSGYVNRESASLQMVPSTADLVEEIVFSSSPVVENIILANSARACEVLD